jgi:L-ascorbate metabolism protein UlaG (beta-lactamase superfamily)
MEVQLIRHATLLVEYGTVKLLVDPLFSPKEGMPPIDNSPNSRKNPLVGLPVKEEVLLQVDAVLLTHSHFDHFDEAAQKAIPKSMPIFCQPADGKKLQNLGFRNTQVVTDTLAWQGITLSRTGGQHGTGNIGDRMGIVSGYVLQQWGQPTLYISGDTIWCPAVEQALVRYQPEVIVAFAGAAQFLCGDPITMSGEDILQVCRQAPQAKVVVIHMEAYNHCLLTRRQLHEQVVQAGLLGQVLLPADGEVMGF